jgi:hypothetical protein
MFILYFIDVGKYSYERFRLTAGFITNSRLLYDHLIKGKSFSAEKEDNIFKEYLKCYELLSSDCFAKLNETYFAEYEEFGGIRSYKDFILHILSVTDHVRKKYFLRFNNIS